MVAMQIWKNADPVLLNLLTYQKKPLIWILNVVPFNGLKGPTSWPPLSLISSLISLILLWSHWPLLFGSHARHSYHMTLALALPSAWSTLLTDCKASVAGVR